MTPRCDTTHHPGCACHEARHAEELARLTAERDAARADHAAAEGCLAGIVRAWQRARESDRSMAGLYVQGLQGAIEDARDGRDGAWWEVSRG